MTIVQEVAPCKRCETILPVTEFHTQRRINKRGEVVYYRRKICKGCVSDYNSKYYKTRKAIKNFEALQERTFIQKVKDFITNLF